MTQLRGWRLIIEVQPNAAGAGGNVIAMIKDEAGLVQLNLNAPPAVAAVALREFLVDWVDRLGRR